ncbi:FeoA family protein [Afifella pfennigii]|uniref:FeoA family protein n=1 Tax=Afifella pfennigii TaxID=209897 RepID=UPI001AEBF894|nr:FeoA family protein [Afifella pfennigii]
MKGRFLEGGRRRRRAGWGKGVWGKGGWGRGGWGRGGWGRDGGPGKGVCAHCLNDLAPGMTCRIARLHGCGAIRQRLIDLGLVYGTEVTLIRAAPLNDPIAIRVGDAVLTVRRAEAATIEVVCV